MSRSTPGQRRHADRRYPGHDVMKIALGPRGLSVLDTQLPFNHEKTFRQIPVEGLSTISDRSAPRNCQSHETPRKVWETVRGSQSPRRHGDWSVGSWTGSGKRKRWGQKTEEAWEKYGLQLVTVHQCWFTGWDEHTTNVKVLTVGETGNSPDYLCNFSVSPKLFRNGKIIIFKMTKKILNEDNTLPVMWNDGQYIIYKRRVIKQYACGRRG